MTSTPPACPGEKEKSVSSVNAEERMEELKSVDNWTLRPADHGAHAWLFLCASFLMEGLALGFPLAYGVFQSYYSTHEPFVGASGLPAVATCAMGIFYLGMPIIMSIQRLYPNLTRWAPLAGILLMSLSLVGASFSTKVTHLIVTQGVLFGIGSSFAYCPCVAYVNEWFIKRKGTAYGIMWSGTGLSGSILPFVLNSMLRAWGFRTTLRVWAAAFLVITLPLVYFIKPRLPPQLARPSKRNPLDFRFMLSRTFMLHQLANIVQGLGSFLPSIFLPTYAASVLGVGGTPSAVTILLMSLGTTVACPAMGWLTDRLQVTTCLFVATFGAAVSTFFLWGFSTSFGLFLVYCGCYGMFAGSYTTAWTGLMRQVTTDKDMSSAYDCDAVDPVMVISVMATGRGIGGVLSGPLSEALIRGMPWRGEALAAYGSGYGPLIVFTGVTAALSGLVLPWRYMGWIR
ncbi:hypothetical protein E4U51_002260 [Claviceps purpurea]|nr:hypothetical protein E4U51_002260 [Claviceps purpurea]